MTVKGFPSNSPRLMPTNLQKAWFTAMMLPSSSVSRIPSTEFSQTEWKSISELRKQAEAALRSSEMLFHSVWENSVDGMRLTDEDGNIIAVNQAFCKLVGMSRGELEGKPFTVIYADEENPERFLQKYRQRFHDRVIEKQIERKLMLRNGNPVTFEDTNSF